MLGFNSIDEARDAYLSNYEDGWKGLGNITETNVDDFSRWANKDGARTKPFAEYKVNQKSEHVTKNKADIPVMTEEEYLSSKGYSYLGFGDVVLHKGRQKTATQQEKMVNRQAQKDIDYQKKREELRNEYQEKIAKGEIRKPSVFESTIKAANGNEDLESTQAARRLLKKRFGIDWNEYSGDKDIRFQTASEKADADLEVANNRFNGELDNFKEGTHKGDLHLGNPGEILKASGVNESEITLSPSVLTEKINQHGLTTEDLKGLAKAIQDPIMVYDWGTKAKSKIIITDLTRANGEKITVAIATERKGKNLSVNDISSIHGKSVERTLSDFSKAVGENPIRRLEDNLKYVNKEKALDWLGLAPPKGASSQVNQELNSIAKVIQEFENPKLSSEKLQESQNDFTPITKEQTDALIEPLKAKGLAKDVIYDEAEYDKTFDKAKEKLKYKDGTTYGFVTDDKVVYLDPRKLNANTPIHEFGHLYWNVMPAEMKSKITELLKQTPKWKELEDNTAYSHLETDDQKADEIFNTLLGNEGEKSQKVQEVIGNDVKLTDKIRMQQSE